MENTENANFLADSDIRIKVKSIPHLSQKITPLSQSKNKKNNSKKKIFIVYLCVIKTPRAVHHPLKLASCMYSVIVIY